MPAKKESGPPPKPKPEELIAEFKEKFEIFSSETNKQHDELDQKIISAKDSLSNLEQIIENNHSESQVKTKQLLEEINESIEQKFKEVAIEIQESFQSLEKQLTDGTHYIQDDARYKTTHYIFAHSNQGPSFFQNQNPRPAESWRPLK